MVAARCRSRFRLKRLRIAGSLDVAPRRRDLLRAAVGGVQGERVLFVRHGQESTIWVAPHGVSNIDRDVHCDFVARQARAGLSDCDLDAQLAQPRLPLLEAEVAIAINLADPHLEPVADHRALPLDEPSLLLNFDPPSLQCLPVRGRLVQLGDRNL